MVQSNEKSLHNCNKYNERIIKLSNKLIKTELKFTYVLFKKKGIS